LLGFVNRCPPCGADEIFFIFWGRGLSADIEIWYSPALANCKQTRLNEGDRKESLCDLHRLQQWRKGLNMSILAMLAQKVDLEAHRRVAQWGA
jgi:hypothetical protein